MGFFAWTCAECGKSVVSTYKVRDGRAKTWEANAVLVTPNGEEDHAGVYDGYGRIGTTEVLEWAGDGDHGLGCDRAWGEVECPPNRVIKIVHGKCYDGQAYEDLPASTTCPDQGYF